MMNIFTRLIAGGLPALAFALTPSQLLPAHRSPADVTFHEHLDKLIEKASVKTNEAIELRRQKRYQASEAACEAAIDILKNAPFAANYAKDELAQTYLAEGNYQLALDTWLPRLTPGSMSTANGCGVAIAYARLNRASEGKKFVLQIYEEDERGLWFLDKAGLPCSSEVTPDSVEATALLLFAVQRLDYTHPEETLGQLRRAMKLAPRNGAIPYAYAWCSISLSTRTWQDEAYYLRLAYRLGDEKLKKLLAPFLAEQRIKVED